jgi:two-component system response regulator HydG
MIASGQFRNDLFYRLKVVTVHLPPLRERRDDIIPLMEHFRKMFVRRHGKPAGSFSQAVTRLFYAYPWPGNIRQLRNFVETMVVLDADSLLDTDDLPPELIELGAQSGEMPAIPSPPSQLPQEGPESLIGQPLDTIERWAILETLKRTNDNREEAARVLGIGARTLYRKLDRYRQEGSTDGTPIQDSALDPEDPND